MGPYCQFCDRRCLLLRVLRDGSSVLLATCTRGMAHDLGKTGQTHETAVNPITDPAAAAAIAAAPEPLLPEEFCSYCKHHANAHNYAAADGTVPCVACHPVGVCERDRRTCRGCLSPIILSGGEWVVTGTGTSGDGLSYCPPDPDAERVGKHRPEPAAVSTRK